MDNLEDIVSEPTLTDWIQAGSAFITVLFVVLTFHLTRRMYHAPYRTILRPISLRYNSNKSEWNIIIKNIGPGIAYNVEVSTITTKKLERDLLDKDKYWSVDQTSNAEGVGELIVGAEENFVFGEGNSHLTLNPPFKIKWESTSGKQYSYLWTYHSSYQNSRFRKLNIRETAKYYYNRTSLTLLSPIVNARKYIRMKIYFRLYEVYSFPVVFIHENKHFIKVIIPDFSNDVILTGTSYDIVRIETYKYLEYKIIQLRKQYKPIPDSSNIEDVRELFSNSDVKNFKVEILKKSLKEA